MTSRKIIITRAQKQGQEFVSLLLNDISRARADNFLIEPVITINQISSLLPSPNPYDGIIITSVNGVEVLPDGRFLQPQVFCVGVSTAAALQNKGIGEIRIIAPFAQSLCEGIEKLYADKNLHLLYIRGKDISFDIKTVLGNLGHNVDEIISYEAQAQDSFSDVFINMVKEHNVSAVTFFSKKSAESFADLAKKSNIIEYLKGVNALCMSSGMIECLNSIFHNNIEVSKTPDARGMIKLVRHFL